MAPDSTKDIVKRTPPPKGEPVVRLEGITKHFGQVTANRDITLDIHAGRIKALLGENGAGKSTLMSILSGRYPPDAGRIIVDGRPTRFTSTSGAIEAGIGMVYQHFMLVHSMTVAENVMLGQEGSFWTSPRRMQDHVAALAERYGLHVDPSSRIAELSMGERQRVEILKLLHRNSRVLILDEPTTVLTPRETGQLFEALWAMADAGKSIVFISHKLEEVLAVADEVAILRRGCIVDEMDQNEIGSKEDLATRMVGREVLLAVDRHSAPMGETVLELDGLSGNGLENISLTVRQGEVTAVVGVAGNGQKALVEIVTGLRPPGKGQVRLLGRPWREFYAHPDWKETLSYVPEDRMGLAACPELDLTENVLLTTRAGFARGPWLERARAADVTRGLARRHHVTPQEPAALARQLSGGNLQKLVLAREFYRKPRIIVAEQPTQGLDVAATEEVWHRLLNARAKAGVLLVTGDVTEALQLADTIAVIFRGRIMDVFDAADQSKVKAIGRLMAGLPADPNG